MPPQGMKSAATIKYGLFMHCSADLVLSAALMTSYNTSVAPIDL